MHHYKRAVNFCVFILIVALAFNPNDNPFFISEVNTFEVMKTNDTLYQEIQAKSSDYSLPPQNAYIDTVWKKTPGRNGLKVNIDASYEKMKKEGVFHESLLVYEQIPPEIRLNDLDVSPIYRGHPEKDMVAFLINVSWGTEHIPDILNILKEHNVKATFFLEGQWAQENAEFVEMIDEQGHTIGNHAYNHPNMSRLSQQENTRQINQTNEIIKAITGDAPKWFAPPSGDYTDQVVQVADDLHMETILWTVDTIDWKNPSVSVMINRVNEKLHPGATVLMHPTESIAEGLDPLIKDIKENGYRIGTLDKLLNEER
ncbi:polysaccharide deacetylase family protein [Virgibacillus sp. NKC19-3]|uniref:polysaccharide deacetylase family protein n=1 Tax=Virgibacillus saliphilus TaxID=2831674 RepID=UPI001C9A4E0F|nr:polysaccharide deacetylase family protein [Virgibacillus sp. NKC19-3]MBY7143621.1 polysaccharide deacetylase family protein [Virgibacillus sp. NKC19-3]